MKLIIIFSLLLSISFSSISQDTIRLKHTNYTTVFSKLNHYPVLVEWWITKKNVDCKTPMERKNNFQPDPLLPNETDLLEDYKGSGTDRGPIISSRDLTFPL